MISIKGNSVTKIASLFILNLLLISFIGLFTASPTKVSGNGNPAFLLIALYIPLAMLFGSRWIKGLRNLFLRFRIKTIVFLVSLAFIILGIYLMKVRYDEFYAVFSAFAMEVYDEPYNINFLNASAFGITIYTNSIYFNYITFLMYVSVLNIIAAVISPRRTDE